MLDAFLEEVASRDAVKHFHLVAWILKCFVATGGVSMSYVW